MFSILRRRLSPVVVLAIAVFAAGFDLFSPPSDEPSGPLIINEIHAAPEESDAEFIEILNRSSRVVSLASVTYADANEDFDPVLPSPVESAVLHPGQFLVLVRDSAAAAAAYPSMSDLDPEEAVVFAPPGWEGLNNGGDTVYLRSAGVPTDRVNYDGDWSPRGTSMERIDPNGPSAAFNFAASERTATPGRENTTYNPDVTPPEMVFAEEVRGEADATGVPTQKAPRIAVWFSEGVDTSRVASSMFELDDRSVRDVQFQEDGRRAVITLRENLRTDATSILEATGLADRTGNVREVDTLSVAAQPQMAALAINELMFDPRADGHDGWPNQTEYVEIRNQSARHVTLRGVGLTGAPDENGERDRLAQVAATQSLPPGGYAVLYAAGDLPGDTPLQRFDALAEAFPSADTSRGVWIEAGGSSLRLTNTGRTVMVHAPSRAVLDSVPYTPDWHAPELVTTDGIALERISGRSPSDDEATWTSSTHPEGGTPGRTNSVRLPAPSTTQARVRVAPSPFSRSRDGATRIEYRLDRPAASLRVRIFDAHGRLVRTLAQSLRSGPDGELLWDGRTDDGRDARMGIYIILFESVDMAGATVETAKVPVVLARE